MAVFIDRSNGRFPDNFHNPSQIPLTGVEKAEGNFFVVEMRRVERQCTVYIPHKRPEFLDGSEFPAVPLKWFQHKWSANSSSELGIGIQDFFCLSELADQDHGDMGLINNVFEEICDGVYNSAGSARVLIPEVLKLINKNHLHFTPLDQIVDAHNHVPFCTTTGIRVM